MSGMANMESEKRIPFGGRSKNYVLFSIVWNHGCVAKCFKPILEVLMAAVVKMTSLLKATIKQPCVTTVSLPLRAGKMAVEIKKGYQAKKGKQAYFPTTGGPVDNRPSTDKLHHFVREKKK